MSAAKFKVGDTVKLKSDGFSMTVNTVTLTSSGSSLKCIYQTKFDGLTHQTIEIDQDCFIAILV